MILKYDFHIHSCLSPCADNDMTPYNIVNMAKLAGLDIIALTDHNSCLNCPAAVEAGKEAGLTVVPGMELCTSEEVHIICLFPSLKKAMSFSVFVFANLPQVKNRTEIFGEQLVMDAHDQIKGLQEILLTTAAGISVSDVVKTVGSFGGVCYPAHIDRSSYSVLSNLGSISPEMGFNAAEITASANLDEYKRKYPIINELFIVKSSDAHYLANIGEVSAQINLKSNNIKSTVYFFNKLFSKIN